MIVAVLVSNRPDWVDHGLESADRIADQTVFRFHDTGAFVDVFNDALAEAATLAPVCLKVDDHDVYPDDHATILKYWTPEHTVWGKARRFTCDGRELKPRATMCSSALPTSLTLQASPSGRLWRSLYNQTVFTKTVTGVRKRVCSADWNWDAPIGKVCAHDVI